MQRLTNKYLKKCSPVESFIVFDSENIGLRNSLSLSNFFDSDKECLNPILEQNFYTVLMLNFLARWQDEKKNIICSEIKDFDSAIELILHQKGIP